MSVTLNDLRALRLTPIHDRDEESRWWRSSVIYQVYPRSFRDLNGDGIGDLPGITAEMEQLADLGIDALWLSPFYPSPQLDGGYDVSDYCDVDPAFGTLQDFDALMEAAGALSIKVIIDLVPNHCSHDHPLFRAALAAEPGSPERELFVFRDGRGESGQLPPNNWQSHFGGPAWTRVTESDGSPGQWYLHLFDSSQPDFNWDHEGVRQEFDGVLRFWLDRGVAGFRVDAAHTLIKADGLPDWGGRADGKPSPGYPFTEAPMFGQPRIQEIFQRWRRILDEYDGERILCSEANAHPIERMADWVRPGQMHQTFNFSYLEAPWDAAELRRIITSSLEAFDAVEAPTTWVLSNHDVLRHATRFGQSADPARPGDGIGPEDEQPDHDLGVRRARAASLFTLGLPGGVYLYQGEELGLTDHTTMPHEFRQDPTYQRTGGQRVGRDGCRVPLPWTRDGDSLGFSAPGTSWLPQPQGWAELSREAQRRDPSSTLALYRSALALRRTRGLGAGSLAWAEDFSGDGCLGFVNDGILVLLNLNATAVDLPDLPVLLRSRPETTTPRVLGSEECVWLQIGQLTPAA
ncbi:glycoside hydrolase family 13 protein [Kocuria coralli]|uniref:Glycoside hydrolase family 13 protein n=1 Tax=Kocuria coralli TaxID=1461025 RepID=A0A5J5KV35_9MICC|nr:alpha-amylase family glycosyl hydrolase [Kocuria coralli]KAA9393559.1 glycoside hydrolase family 13 protein [Kocuria coralli]